MLPEKPWKPDLLARLFVGLLIGVFLGPLLLGVVEFQPASAKLGPLAFYALAGGALAFSIAALALNLLPWPLEGFSRRLAALCLCVFISLNLSAWVMRSNGGDSHEEASIGQVIISTLTFQGTALLLVSWLLWQQRTGCAEAFGIKSRGLGRALLWGVLLALVAVPVGWLLQAGCAKALTLVGYEAKEQRMVEILRLTETWPARIYIAFAAVVLAPLAEETLFRGILYTAVKQLGYPRVALWGSSLLFAAIHANLPSFLPLVLLAVALAMVYEKTNNLLAPMTAHACFNAANAAMLYALKAGYID